MSDLRCNLAAANGGICDFGPTKLVRAYDQLLKQTWVRKGIYEVLLPQILYQGLPFLFGHNCALWVKGFYMRML